MAYGASTESAGSGWTHFDEMRSARRVQSRLLPSLVPRPGGLECAGLSLPARGVGGDFYDFIEAAPGRVALVLGDVSGKGVPAALMMATLQASLRSHYALAGGDLERLLVSVNRLFLECTAPEHYASLFVGEYHEASGRFRYANCGHVPPVLLRPGLRVERLRPTATVLGMFDRWTCGTREIPLSPGDLLLLVSDGATEATCAGGEAFGDERLIAAIEAHRELRAGALVRAISDEAEAFSGGERADDLTIVAARVRGRRGAPVAACTAGGENEPRRG
ncbi:MAG: PP2C family protein-serine/threonine phosphatase [Acidobacteriia bacterium]|nr:PP2C family protein-serine/threonine phosphatase [Terriglobia bacterium]